MFSHLSLSDYMVLLFEVKVKDNCAQNKIHLLVKQGRKRAFEGSFMVISGIFFVHFAQQRKSVLTTWTFVCLTATPVTGRYW